MGNEIVALTDVVSDQIMDLMSVQLNRLTETLQNKKEEFEAAKKKADELLAYANLDGLRKQRDELAKKRRLAPY